MDNGIRTRSKARQQAEQWQYVPAPAKIFSLLADTLVEAKEGGGAADSDDDSWETDSDNGSESVRSVGRLLKPNDLLRGSGVNEQFADICADGHEDENDGMDADLAGLDLTAHICQQFRHLAQLDQTLFQSCCGTLNSSQLQAVQACF